MKPTEENPQKNYLLRLGRTGCQTVRGKKKFKKSAGRQFVNGRKKINNGRWNRRTPAFASVGIQKQFQFPVTLRLVIIGGENGRAGSFY